MLPPELQVERSQSGAIPYIRDLKTCCFIYSKGKYATITANFRSKATYELFNGVKTSNYKSFKPKITTCPSLSPSIICYTIINRFAKIINF